MLSADFPKEVHTFGFWGGDGLAAIFPPAAVQHELLAGLKWRALTKEELIFRPDPDMDLQSAVFSGGVGSRSRRGKA